MIGSAALDLVVDAAATYRLTRLITADTFPPVKALRDAIVERHSTSHANGAYDQDSWAELIQCPFCASWWIAAGVVAARALAPSWWRPVATALALSAIAGNVSAYLDDGD